MRRSTFSETRIVGILKDAESGVPVPDLLRKYGVSKATFFKWRGKYGGAYNCERPHDRLGRVPPLTLLTRPLSAAQSPFELSA